MKKALLSIAAAALALAPGSAQALPFCSWAINQEAQNIVDSTRLGQQDPSTIIDVIKSQVLADSNYSELLNLKLKLELLAIDRAGCSLALGYIAPPSYRPFASTPFIPYTPRFIR